MYRLQLIAHSFKLEAMYIVSVLPLTKTFGQENLDYFSATSYEPGMVVKIPLRAREARALVLESRPAEMEKMELRNKNFQLKKIKGSGSKTGKLFVNEAFIRAVKKFAKYSAQNFSSVLSALLPVVLFEVKRNFKQREPKCSLDNDISAFQGNDEERFSSYRSLIREVFARKKSFFLLVPTTEDARMAEKELSRGIEQFTGTFYSGKTKKEVEKMLKIIDDHSHPALTIGTPQFLCLLRDDTEVIALDRENARTYKTFNRPFVDFRNFVRILAREYCARLLLGSEILTVDTMHEVRENEINQWGHMKMRETTSAKVSVVSMVKKETDEPFKIFSQELKEELENVVRDRKKIFLFGARKGLSPTTVCADCETLVSCNICGAPLVLYGKEKQGKSYFLCHKCGEKKTAKDECSYCGGWRLITLGIGIEGIEKEVKNISPYAKIFVLSKEIAHTTVKAKKVVEEFLNTAGSVLMGTEMALHYLRTPVDVSAVVSADSLLGIPDFRINERMMSLLTRIRSLGKERVIFQTRNIDNPVFDLASNGNYVSFFEKELMERKKFAFPPFSIFIKISWEESPARAENSKTFVKDLFGEEIQVLKVRIGSKKSKYIALLKLEGEPPKKSWPKDELAEKLLSLPPQFVVEVNPDALF